MLICCFCCWVTVAKLVICASDDSMFVVVVLHCTLKSTGPFFFSFFFSLVLCMTWLFCHFLIRRRMPHCEMEQFCFMEAQWSCYAASICLWHSSFACKWALVRAVKKKTNGLWSPVKIHVMVHSVCIPAFDSNARTSGTWCTCFLKIVEAASLRTQP